MKLMSWNVNGLRAVLRRNQFVPFIAQTQPDILCLQETKAEPHDCDIAMDGYELIWNSSTTRKGYSGTAIFTRQRPLHIELGFPKKLLKKYRFQDNYGDTSAEGRLLTVEFTHWFLVNAYTPNAKRDLSRLELRHKIWDPAFLEHVKTLEETKPVIFCGDLNVAHTPDDLANPKENEGEHGFTSEEREGIERVIQAGFVDTFRLFTQGNGHYTWWAPFANSRSRNIGWRIDYFFVSNSLKSHVTQAGILAEVKGSDHCPIILEIKTPTNI